MDMNERKELLAQHKYSIWQGKNGKWYTYLPDEQKGKVLKKRTSKKAIEDLVCSFYKEIKEEPTFKVAFEQWLDYKLKMKEISVQTANRYTEDYHRFIRGKEIEYKKMKNLDEDYLETFIKESIADLKLTNKAYSKLRLILRGVLIYAKKNGMTKISAHEFFGDLQLSKRAFKSNVKKKEDQVFSEDEEERLWNHLKAYPLIQNYAIMFAFQTGVRAGELCTLKWSDIVGEEIHIQRTEIVYKNEDGVYKPHIKELPKTDAGYRYIYLAPKAKWILERVKEMNSCSTFIFGKDGHCLHEKTFGYHLKKACRECRLKERSMHKIRKTFGTTLLDGDVDDAIIMETMGHTDINCTKTYYYFSTKNKKEKREQLTKALS